MLREVLERTAFNASELARRVGCDQSYVARLLNDRQAPNVGILKRLEEVLGLEPGALYQTAYPPAERLPQTKLPRGRPASHHPQRI